MAVRGRPRSFDRDKALRRAMRLFWERGYDGTSISDLATEMEINAPSLYAAFSCKEALFREAVKLYGETAGSVTPRAMREEPTAHAAVEAMLRGNVDVYADPSNPAGCLIVLAAVNGNDQNAEVRGFLSACRRHDHEVVRERLDRGISDGDVPAGADTSAAANFYTTVLYGLSIRARDGASHDELHTVVTAAMTAWDGVVAPQAMAG